MQDYISERVVKEGLFIMETNSTVRAAADHRTYGYNNIERFVWIIG